ncbi:2TM domain-containing protein [Robertkochia aurantiaca]|uniref:2TM domain-containing protein n=1 Tax=Robertkochia aurantiaca TaxID=2873700 RepID=UPI001CCD504A|nr:2TM domain-containing protein [Robertkochia sp. 3YJGBD-33]
MEKFSEEDRYLRAKQKVEQIKGFYGNLTSYIVVITFLAILNYYTNEWRYPWFLWAAGGWGLGVFFHAARTFNWNPFFNKDWEQRKIQEFMNEEEKGAEGTRWE